MQKVSLFKFEEDKLDELIKKGFHEIGLDYALRQAKTVCVKPNLVTDIEQYIKNGANTDIRIIESVLKYLSNYNIKVILGESDTGTALKGRKLEKALKIMGVYKLKEKYKFDIINFSKVPLAEVSIPKGLFLKKIEIAKILRDTDIIINLPKLKTHKYSTITCALKNMFGAIPDPLRIKYHENIHRVVSDLNRIFIKKTFVVTDAIVGMEGKGPIYGNPVVMNALVFANSMFCNDLIACKLMSVNPQSVKHLQYVENYLSIAEKCYKLKEHISIDTIAKKFKPSRKNIYVFLEGKLMQHTWAVKIIYSKWFQTYVSYKLRNILKFFRGGSYDWYIKNDDKVEKEKFKIPELNWRGKLIPILSFLQGSKRFKYYSKILNYERLSELKIKQLQENKLKNLLIYSYRNVPYYKKILTDCKVIKNNKVYLSNFDKIPILTKDIIKNNFENIKSCKLGTRHTYVNHSGGSTGEPIEFIQDKEYDDWNIANKIYYKHIGGYNLGEKELRIWGSERDFIGDKEKPVIRIRNFFFNRKDLNAFTMTEENMEKYLREINSYKPRWIEAYVQPMYELALFAEKQKIPMYSPKGILTSAGTLYPVMKDKIETIFNCKVWNRYGSREVGDIAFGFENLKISVWNNKVEIINGRNGLGKVLITNLNNYSFPIIRYDIGDIASEGNSWGWLKNIEGREMAVIRTKQGKIIPGEFFIHFLGVVMNDGSISKFQIIQNSYQSFTIRVVIKKDEDFNRLKKQIEELIQRVMEYKCVINWDKVKDIDKLPSGKYSYIISKVPAS